MVIWLIQHIQICIFVLMLYSYKEMSLINAWDIKWKVLLSYFASQLILNCFIAVPCLRLHHCLRSSAQ